MWLMKNCKICGGTVVLVDESTAVFASLAVYLRPRPIQQQDYCGMVGLGLDRTVLAQQQTQLRGGVKEKVGCGAGI